MRGFNCLVFTIFLTFSVSHESIFPDVLQRDIRSKREGSCGENIDLERTGGLAEIQLRTENVNGTEVYRDDEDCTWTLTTAQDQFMVLKSDYFRVEKSHTCELDFVEIRENYVGTKSRYCGWDPLTYITLSNEIKLQFRSDVSFADKGFKFIIESVKKNSKDTGCSGSVYGGGDSMVIFSNGVSGRDCFYRIQATGDKVIKLNLIMLDFGSANCEEEKITIHEGKDGLPLGTVCSGSVNGILPFSANSMIIEYRSTVKQEGDRFIIKYMFVEDNITPTPVPSTTISPVGGNNDCSGMYKGIDSDDDTMIYTAPEYEDNKKCIVVIRNDRLPRHVVQIKFVYFDVENSNNCLFDSLKILSGEREDSASLNGPYCGKSLHGRTFLTRGNSLRLEYTTDISFALRGFKAKISFVQDTDCTCKGNKICIRQDYEKKCIRGKYCEANICKNGGTCINIGSTQKCYCPKGFNGEDCSQKDGNLLYYMHFISAPGPRILKRGQSLTEECKVKVSPGGEVEYNWSFKGTLIEPYRKENGYGFHPGGLLQIDNFSDELVGQYSCFATTSAGTAEHTFEYRITEDCDLKINQGPQSEIKKIDEMALLVCYVDSRVKEVRWKKDGLYIDYDKDSRIKKMSNNYLYISHIELSDAGIYQCEAEDGTGCYSYKEGELQVVDAKPLSKYCGVSIHDQAITAFWRISRGSEALPNMHPWHVTFRTRGEATKYIAYCGGTLISRRFVVTAAHCIIKFKDMLGASFTAENVQLLLGTTDCTGTQNYGIRRTVRSYTVYPDYEDRGVYDNDIALIELDSPVQYTNSVRPICIKKSDYNDRVFLENSGLVGRVGGKVAGCGATRRNSQPAKRLQMLSYNGVHGTFNVALMCNFMNSEVWSQIK